MQVGVDEIVQEYHLHHGLESDPRQLLPVLPRVVPVLPPHEVEHRLPLDESLHEDLPARKTHHRLGEGDLRLPLEVPPEPPEVVRLDPQVELREHDVAELVDAVLHAQVVEVEVGYPLEYHGELVDDVEVEADLLEYVRVLDLDCHGRPGRVEAVGAPESRLVDLRDASGPDGYGGRGGGLAARLPPA